MGGINPETTPGALKLGFKGVGFLGGIWNSDEPVESLKEMLFTLDVHKNS